MTTSAHLGKYLLFLGIHLNNMNNLDGMFKYMRMQKERKTLSKIALLLQPF